MLSVFFETLLEGEAGSVVVSPQDETAAAMHRTASIAATALINFLVISIILSSDALRAEILHFF